MNNRPKFLKHYCPGVQLRVEQIGPCLWGGAIFWRIWEPFTESTEDAVKRGAIEMAERKFGLRDGGDSDWRTLSDVSDEDWARMLGSLGFPGYPPRDGFERWAGF